MRKRRNCTPDPFCTNDGDWRESDRVSVGRELFVFSPAAATAAATKAGECAREAGSDQARPMWDNSQATWAFKFSASTTNIPSVISFDETKICTQSNRRSSICSVMAADMQY